MTLKTTSTEALTIAAHGYVGEGKTAWDRENLHDCIDELAARAYAANDWEAVNARINAAAQHMPEQIKALLRVVPGMSMYLAGHQHAAGVVRNGLSDEVGRWVTALDAFGPWLRDVLAAREAQSPWVPVAERLPEERTLCLVRIGDQTHVAQFDPCMASAKWWHPYGVPSRLYQEPTHWMLPPPAPAP